MANWLLRLNPVSVLVVIPQNPLLLNFGMFNEPETGTQTEVGNLIVESVGEKSIERISKNVN